MLWEQNPSCVSALKQANNYHNTGHQNNGHKNQGFHTQGGQKINDDTVHGRQITHIYIKYLTVFFEWIQDSFVDYCPFVYISFTKTETIN